VKFVNESIEDVLKPKSKEDIIPLEKKVEADFFMAVDWAKESIEMIKGLKADNADPDYIRGTYEEAHSNLLEKFYQLPEYLREKHEEEFHDVHHQLDVAGGMALSESMIMEQKKLKLAAGFVILQDGKILLAHPTNARWKGSYSIPKGHIESGEDFIDTARRETIEEIGYKVNGRDIVSGPHFVDYTDKNNKLYKRVYFYVVRPSEEINPRKLKLQKSEVDWVGFLSKNDAKERIHPKMMGILKYLK